MEEFWHPQGKMATLFLGVAIRDNALKLQRAASVNSVAFLLGMTFLPPEAMITQLLCGIYIGWATAKGVYLRNNQAYSGSVNG